MAGAHCATFSLLTPPKIQLKPVLIISSVSNQLPLKPTNRKNHLRPKILKTLTQPLPSSTPQLPPTNPIIPIISPPQPDTVFDSPLDKVEEFQVSETTSTSAGEYSGSFGNFSANSVLKYGLSFVGLFVFQSICTVWILGNANSDRKDDNLNNSDLGIDKIHKVNGKNGSKLRNVVYLDESELELKIEEIRTMAKAARKMEKNELKGGDVDGNGIEKEVGARLVRLKKRLNSKREKFPASFMNYLDKFGNVEDEVSKDSFDVKEANTNLMLKKKFKFKSPSVSARSKPKGFPGFGDDNVDKNEYNDLTTVERSGSVGDDGFDEADERERRGILNGDMRESVFETVEMDSGKKLNSLQNDEKKLEKERGRAKMGVADTDTRSGAVQETQGKTSVKLRQSKNSRDLETQNSQNFTKEDQETNAKSDKHALVGRNGSSKHGEGGNESLENKVRNRPADVKTDLWWLNLPYVLAIHMRSGSDSEGPGGLYTLRITSQAQNESDSSCIVAFEDRGDANNFCYLLESFFEDVVDVRADTVLLSIKELLEEVDSETKKVIVVKRRQLKLYAGQPLADVEIALHSLVQ